MTKLNIGDRVKPAANFAFGVYSGPKDADSRGIVTEVVNEGVDWPVVLVNWAGEGEEDNVWDHSTDAEDELLSGYAVELAEAA